MNKIIDFLKNQDDKVSTFTESTVDKTLLSKAYNNVRNIIFKSDLVEKNVLQLKINPNIEIGQLWLCKQQYYDIFGNKIIGNFPFLVIVISNPEKLANENFIRVQPISPFTEMKADDEIMISDKTITGFDFIVESWNEQPILTHLLDEFVGNIDIKSLKTDKTEIRLSEIQKEFRKAEIRNTAYLRQSVNSLIEFEEIKDENTVFINIDNSIHLPKKLNIFNESEQTYLQAAKKGKIKDRPTFLFEKEVDGVGIKIKVIQKDKNYILSVKQPDKIEIKDEEGNILKQYSPNLYDKVESGLYFINIAETENEIRIRLK